MARDSVETMEMDVSRTQRFGQAGASGPAVVRLHEELPPNGVNLLPLDSYDDAVSHLLQPEKRVNAPRGDFFCSRG